MSIAVTRSGCCGLESGEDQVSMYVRNVVQAPKSNLMARDVAFDQRQMGKQVGQQCEAAEHEDLSEEEDLLFDIVVVDD